MTFHAMTTEKQFELFVGPIVPPNPPGLVNIDAAPDEVAQSDEVSQRVLETAQRGAAVEDTKSKVDD